MAQPGTQEPAQPGQHLVLTLEAWGRQEVAEFLGQGSSLSGARKEFKAEAVIWQLRLNHSA